MNKKFIVLLSLMLTLEALVFGKVLLTDREVALLDDLESTTRSEDMTLTLNLPLIGELDLKHYFDPQTRNLIFVNKNRIKLDLSPIPIQLEEIHIVENLGDLELRAKAKVFGRNAQLSLSKLKRAADIKIIENQKSTKVFLDISEMTLDFNFNELNIRLLNELNLNFNTASLVIRKNKPHQFLVKNNILDQSINFDFTFLEDGTTLIKYFITNDIALSKLFSGVELDFDTIILKSLSLTSEHKTAKLFSKDLDFGIHGNAFADVQLKGVRLPINLIDLPAILNYADNKYSIEIKLPEFELPLLGVVSKGFIKMSDSFPFQLIGQGILNLPQIGGQQSYKLDAIYKNGKIVFRGKFDHSLKYKNFIIELPKFIYHLDTNSLKIIGKSTAHDIKCLVDLTFKNINSWGQVKPELKIRSLQKSWKPFNESSNSSFSNVELKEPHILVTENNGQQSINVIGRAILFNYDMNAHIKFINSPLGMMPIFTLFPSGPWKISDSFERITDFDDFTFEEPQFILSEVPFYDPIREIYVNKGISFRGKLLLNQSMKPLGNLIALTHDDIMISGSISDDCKNFVWHAPLATGLSSKSKLLTFGPIHLELNSHAPLSIVSRVTLRPTNDDVIDFSGDLKLNGTKLFFDSVSPSRWSNIFSIPGFHMNNPKLQVILDAEDFGMNTMPDSVTLEGDIVFGNNTMRTKSIMNEDFSKFALVGHLDHVWLNELADIIITNKHSYSILPPLEIKNITFNIAEHAGLRLDGTLGLFGFDVMVHSDLNNMDLKINGQLPKMVSPGIEISGLDHKMGPQLLIELIGDIDSSRMVGVTKLGDLIEIHDPITINAQGCSFESNTTLGRHKFGIKVNAFAAGFIKIPQFTLDIMFKNDALGYFKNAMSKELAAIDAQLKAEVYTVISDIKILQKNAYSITDPEQNRIALWALEENKRKIDSWIESGLIALNDTGNYRYYGIINNFDLTSITFNDTADKIIGSKIPLVFNTFILNRKDELKFVIDFANLDQSITALVREFRLFAH